MAVNLSFVSYLTEFDLNLRYGRRVKQDPRGSEEVQDSRDPEGMRVAWDQLDHQDSRCVIVVLSLRRGLYEALG